jgi:hypothetical protein
VLRVHDPTTESFREVLLRRPGLIEVCAHVRRAQTRALDLTALRIMLVADLIARVAELNGIQAFTAHFESVEDSTGNHAFGLAPESLGIHPPAPSAGVEDGLRAHCDGPADVHVIGPYARPPISGGMTTAVGTTHGDETGDEDGALAAEVTSERGGDPLAVRVALSSIPYFQNADIRAETLTSALDRLGWWRHQVALWAESPSRPVPSSLKTKFHEFFDRLAIWSVMELLNEFADKTDVPPGAKFEAFVFADRVLGLDLARSVGQPSG